MDSLWEASSPRAQRSMKRAAAASPKTPKKLVLKSKGTAAGSLPVHSTPVRQTRISAQRLCPTPQKQHGTKSSDKQACRVSHADGSKHSDVKGTVGSPKDGIERVDEDIEFNFSSPQKNRRDFSQDLPSPIRPVTRRSLAVSLQPLKTDGQSRVLLSNTSRSCRRSRRASERLLKSASTTEKSVRLDIVKSDKTSDRRKPSRTPNQARSAHKDVKSPAKQEGCTSKQSKHEDNSSHYLSPLSQSIMRAAALGLRSSPRKARVLFQKAGAAMQTSSTCSVLKIPTRELHRPQKRC